MIRLIVSGIWIIIVTSIAVYVGTTWKSQTAETRTHEKMVGDLQRKKTIPINVPMIANGSIEGYIVAQFIYLVDVKKLQQLSVPPDDFITDEAFRTLYATDVNFDHLKKYDLQGLTKAITEKINQRLGMEIIKDVLVEEFTYVPKRDISK